MEIGKQNGTSAWPVFNFVDGCFLIKKKLLMYRVYMDGSNGD